MSVNLLDLAQGYLTDAVVNKAASSLGTNTESVQSGFAHALPALMGGLMSKAGSAEGASGLLGLLTKPELGAGLLDNVGNLFGGENSMSDDLGGTLLNSVLGDKLGGITDLVGSSSGLSSGASSGILKMAMPLLLGVVGKQVGNSGLSGLTSLLGDQTDHLEKAAPSGFMDTMLGSLGVGSLGGLAGGISNLAGGLTGSVAGVASNLTGSAANAAKSVTGSVAGAAGAVGGGAANAAKAVTGSVAGAAGAIGGGAANAAKSVTGSVAGAAGAVGGGAANAAKAVSGSVAGAAGAIGGGAKADGSKLWPILLLLGAGVLGYFGYNYFTGKETVVEEVKTEIVETEVAEKEIVVEEVETVTNPLIGTSIEGFEYLGEYTSRKLTDGTELIIPSKGFESQLIDFLESNKPAKSGWFDLRRVLFNTGSSDLDGTSMNQIDYVVSILNAYPNVHLKIGGYTDNTGNVNSNKKLSGSRAASVLNALVSKGISAERLSSEGYGIENPVASNDTPEGRQMNRRVSGRVVKK